MRFSPTTALLGAIALAFPLLTIAAPGTAPRLSLNGSPLTTTGDPCITQSDYSCGLDTLGRDSINICALDGNGALVWTHLDACDQPGSTACQMLGGKPYCVAPASPPPTASAAAASKQAVGGGKAGAPQVQATTAPTKAPADCQFANQFLCQTQCGKVLIQCTGAGTGAAVCNNGQIGFAANCQAAAAGGGNAGTGAGGSPAKTAPPPPPPPANNPPPVAGKTAADCQFVNQFLCQTQCGKVLIQCTGAGVGAVLPALDEDQAVCNNGQIDFAANCTPAAGQSPPPPTPASPGTIPGTAAGGAKAAKMPPAAPKPAAGAAKTAADCQVANQFLCQTQCGKVLIQCTGPGAGAVLAPLDEAQAVCNNGQIDFAANCRTQA
ncbi:hypothetical protein DFJ73DRAFT_959604 [Zopfochytrium polystomum]|nr:hypothetical protein DFJ73DRAFT_959604 [Zopfochytrium polystomum]